jgi:pyruvate kinase
MRRAKILASLGPACRSPATIRRLVEAGVDGFRINLAHADRDGLVEAAARVRRAAADVGRPVGFLMDLGGPKIRTGPLRGGGPVRLEAGREVRIVEEEIVGDETRFSTTIRGWLGEVPEGSRILLDDGAIELHARECRRDGVRAIVRRGGTLGERKGINLPGVRLSIPSLTESDRASIELGREIGTDFFALSFVHGPDDVREARARIEASGRPAPLVAKIEKAEAIGSLEEIVEAADGILVARGDLGVETAPEEVPVLQKRIIRRANAAGKLVITSTQMLQSMMTNPHPTRAEASDVANTVLDGSDALLLTGETTIGAHPVETVEMMDRIIRHTEASPDVAPGSRETEGEARGSRERAIAEAAAFAAREIGARMIVVFTRSGATARSLAALRPRPRILALSPSEETCRRLALVWGVEPHVVELGASTEESIRRSSAYLLDRGLAVPGEEVVAMGGTLDGEGVSRTMRILRLDR